MTLRVGLGVVLCAVLGALVPAGSAGAALPDPVASPKAFADPPAAARPKFRWWWESPYDAAEFREELSAMADAGFGGVEAAFNESSWANEQQREMLGVALDTAKRRGVSLDMTLGASWPVTTPNTEKGSGLSEQEIYYGRVAVAGGVPFTGPPPPPADDPLKTRGGKLVAVTAARVTDVGQPAVVPVPVAPNTSRPPAAPVKSAVLDRSSLVDLTPTIDANGMVSFAPPGDGTWMVFSFWQRDADEGVMDHISGASAGAVTSYLDEHQLGPAAAALLPGVGGSFFEDSLELDVQEVMWTDGFAAEFKRRRGYDVVPYLPALFVAGMQRYPVPQTPPPADFELPDGLGERVRRDYYETVQDLYVDSHMKVFAAWARGHGMTFRSQAGFGNAFDATRSARELASLGGLPDDESLNAGDPAPLEDSNWRFAMDHYRAVVGGAHQGGAREISTELGAMFFRDQQAGLDTYKSLMDKSWAAGITRPIVHGFAYQPEGARWPGRDQFAGLVAQSWNHRNFPQWHFWKPLASYWARGNMVLQQGRPRTDVAVYRDDFTTTAATYEALAAGLAEYQLDPATGDGLPDLDLPGVKPQVEWDGEAMERAGYSFQYIDPAGLTDRRAAGAGVLYPRGPRYRALVVDARTLPGAAADAISRAVRGGLAVVIVGDAPSRGAGARDAVGEDARVRAAVARMLKSSRVRRVPAQKDVAGALRALGVRPDVAWSGSQPVYTQHRAGSKRDYFYLWNAGSSDVSFNASFAARGVPSRLDLWNGRVSPDAVYAAERGGRTRVPVRLRAGETLVLAFARRSSSRAHVVSSDVDEVVPRGGRVELRALSGSAGRARLSNGRVRRVRFGALPSPLPIDDWKLHVDEVDAGGVKKHDVTLDRLRDWRSIAGLEHAAGTGTYTATLDVAASWIGSRRGVVLDLGRVEGAMQVSMNGRAVAPDSVAGRRFDVTRFVRRGRNTLRVVVATTLKNTLVDDPTQPVFLAHPATQPYGLIGPVRLAPYARALVRLR